MKKMMALLSLCVFSGRLCAMEYFDREMILENGIIYIEERVSVSSNDESCLVYFFRFNERGLLEEEGLQRMSTTVGVVYGESDEVVDWYWNTSSGKEYFSDKFDDVRQFYFELERVREANALAMYSKLDYTDKHIRTFSDPCFSVDADYELTLLNDSNGLPVVLTGTKIKENGDMFSSPDSLTIRYEYKFSHDE